MDTPRAPGAGPTAVRALRVAARALTVTGDARAATAPGGADGRRRDGSSYTIGRDRVRRLKSALIIHC